MRSAKRGLSPSCAAWPGTPPPSKNILGDGVTTTLTPILIGTFDGNVGVLQEVIETSEADTFVRDAAFKALTWACEHGYVSRDDLAAYLTILFHRLMPREEDYVWASWQETIALLGLEHLAPLVAEAFEDGRIDEGILGHSDFLEDLAAGATTAGRAALLQRETIAPLDDAIGELSSWYGFSPQYKLDEEDGRKRARERGELLSRSPPQPDQPVP